MSLQILFGDITEQKVDAIVNPTNHWYSGGGGTDYAIHTAAGPEIEKELANLPTLDTGDIAVTKAYDLPATYVLHTVGPKWRGGRNHEAVLLRSCYTSALFEARRLGCTSIAFPLISSGTFRFPADYASSIAVAAINNYLKIDPSLDVRLVIYPKGPAMDLFEDLGEYIVKHFEGGMLPKPPYEEEPEPRFSRSADTIRFQRFTERDESIPFKELSICCAAITREEEESLVISADEDDAVGEIIPESFEEEEEPEAKFSVSFEVDEEAEIHKAKKKSFVDSFDIKPAPAVKTILPPKEEAASWKPGEELKKTDGLDSTLLLFVNRYLDDHPEEKESDIYKRALVTKDHYSKIKSNKIMPKKYIILALGFALRLTREEMDVLLLSAGLALTTSSPGDIILSYFLDKRIYDIQTINMCLLSYDAQLLGSV